MKNILKNKILFMFLMAFLFLVAINSSCFAFDDVIDIETSNGTFNFSIEEIKSNLTTDNLEYFNSNNFQDYFIIDWSNGIDIVFVESDCQLGVFENDSNNRTYFYSDKRINTLEVKANYSSSRDFYYDVTYDPYAKGFQHYITNNSSSYSFLTSSSIVYSTLDIYNVSSFNDGVAVLSDEVVFQGARPQQVGQLAQIITAETMDNPLQEIMGIIPIIMIVLVGFLGLRKALALLFRILRRS